MNISSLNALAKLISSNPNEAKALVKLVSIDVLKSLGEAKYSILLDNKTLTAQSDKPLSEGAKYWTQLTQNKQAQPQLSNPLKIPLLFDALKNSELVYSPKELHTLLSSKKPEAQLKQTLLEHLSSASSKEEFVNASTLLLSLANNTFTTPLAFSNSFALLQFKKRYNTKTKKTHIDFYAALEFLGPISGLISLDEGEISVELGVAFAKTKLLLEDDLKNLSYHANITLKQKIEPLYNLTCNTLLDVNA